MYTNNSSGLMRLYRCRKETGNKAKSYDKSHILPAICLLVFSFTCGCSGEMQDPVLQLNLSTPEISGKAVSVNGGVAVPLERIQWEWGDGQVDKHQFFPASHTYKKPGKYRITVTVFGTNNTTASKSVPVEIQ